MSVWHANIQFCKKSTYIFTQPAKQLICKCLKLCAPVITINRLPVQNLIFIDRKTLKNILPQSMQLKSYTVVRKIKKKTILVIYIYLKNKWFWKLKYNVKKKKKNISKPGFSEIMSFLNPLNMMTPHIHTYVFTVNINEKSN